MDFTKQETEIIIEALRTEYLHIDKIIYLNKEMKQEELETINKLIEKFKKPQTKKIKFKKTTYEEWKNYHKGK